MKRKFYTLVFLCISFVYVLSAQTAADSIAIAQIKWEVTPISKNAVVKTTNATLFGAPQQISIVQYNPQKHKTLILQPERRVLTSDQAKEAGAKAAINAGYFDMRNGLATTYVKLNGKEVGQMKDNELYRVDGAIVLNKKNMEIYPWNKDNEAELKAKYKTILTTGPLLLKNGVEIKAKSDKKFFGVNPRSFVGIAKNGDIMLIVVDGRHPGNAIGMTINQLAYFSRQLGLVDAVNLDGGGSCCLWSEKQGVINYPYDNKKFDHQGERQVSNIIAIK